MWVLLRNFEIEGQTLHITVSPTSFYDNSKASDKNKVVALSK